MGRDRAENAIFEELRDGLVKRGRELHAEAIDLIEAELALPEDQRKDPALVLKSVEDADVDDVLWELLNDAPQSTPFVFQALVVLVLGTRAPYSHWIAAALHPYEKKPGNRFQTMFLLQGMRDARAVPFLEWMLAPANRRVLVAAPEAYAPEPPKLPGWKPGWCPTLPEYEVTQRHRYQAMMATKGAEEIGRLFRWTATGANLQEQRDIDGALRSLLEESLDPIMAEMAKGDLEVRRQGLEYLRLVEEPRVIPTLLRELIEGDLEPRPIVNILGRFEEGIRAALSLDRNAKHRDHVMARLAEYTYKRELFFDCVREGGAVAEGATEVLLRMNDAEIRRALVQLLLELEEVRGDGESAPDPIHRLPGLFGARALSGLLMDSTVEQDEIGVASATLPRRVN